MRDSSKPFTFLDLIIVVFILTLLPAAAIVQTRRAREQANRIKCASNLKQIGLSIQIYANENKGAFPRTLYDVKAENPIPTEYTGVDAPNPFKPGGPELNDVTAPMFLILRTGDITSEVFICPTSTTAQKFEPPPGMEIKSFSNFASRRNLSYAYTNAYPSAAARAKGFKLNFTLSSDFAIAADMGMAAAGTIASTASRAQMVRVNTPNHAGDGQNVLYADGHVDWTATPFAGLPRPVTGVARDNIYAFGVEDKPGAPSAGTRGAPADQYDSVILPVSEMGPQPGPLPRALIGNAGAANTRISGGLVIAAAVAIGGIAVGLAVSLARLLRAKRDRTLGPQQPPPPAEPVG
jgi:prepilin-type processing-associated H-X9-DG protein